MGPFCLLVNSPWPLIFVLCVFFLFLSVFSLYCWKGVHFSWSLDLNLFLFFFWASFHSLSSPSLEVWPGEGFYIPDPCELTFANTLLLSNAAVSLGGAFVSLEISSSFLIYFSLFSFI